MRLNQKLRQIKILQTLFGLSLKEAKYAVDCGEFILQGEYDKNLVETIRSNSDANIKYEKERKELMKYKSLYFYLVGSINSILNEFLKNN